MTLKELRIIIKLINAEEGCFGGYYVKLSGKNCNDYEHDGIDPWFCNHKDICKEISNLPFMKKYQKLTFFDFINYFKKKKED